MHHHDRRPGLALLCLLALLALTRPSRAEVTLLNVSYDVTRELYKDINLAFIADYEKRTGQKIAVQQSHAGSSAQVRAVIEGLEGDVVTMNQVLDIDTIATKSDLLPKDWATKLPNASVPFTSTILFVVRKGNPKQLNDWADLIKPGVQPIIPNPKTSGNGRYSYLAAWAWASKGGEAKAKEYVKALFSAVPVLDTGGRGATVSFTQRAIGDVLLTFENEAKLIVKLDPQFEIVVPSVSISAENPVAVVEKVAAKKGTTALATAYLQFLYAPEAQTIGARHFFRPVDPKVPAQSAAIFPKLELVSVVTLGGWPAVQAKHFADGGVFDQIYVKR